jgi:hypothetical protein
MPQEPPSSSTPTTNNDPLPTPSGKQLPPSPQQSSSLSSYMPYQKLQQQLQQQQQQYNTTGITEHYGIAAPKRNTISYQKSCILRPIPTSILFGAIFTAYATIMKQTSNSLSSKTRNRRISSTSTGSSSLLRTLGSSVSLFYLYYVMQCPMEAIQNKESYVHNGIAAFTLSYIGLAQQRIGVPFISPYSIYQLPLLTRNLLGASIYSLMAMTFAALYGHKPY